MKIPFKILVVEDDLVTQEILSLYLLEYEHVTVVASGEDAITKCMSDVFDIVLIDIRLKIGMDGVKTFKKIKKIDAYMNIPILAITAYENLSLREFVDIDIFVSKKNILKMKNILISNGYKTQVKLKLRRKLFGILD